MSHGDIISTITVPASSQLIKNDTFHIIVHICVLFLSQTIELHLEDLSDIDVHK